MPDYLIMPIIIFVILPIIIGVFYLWNESAKAAREERRQQEQERRQREAQEEARQREQEDKERRRDNYYLQQLALARQLRRTDQEIEQWARENFKTILAKETATIAEVNLKLENWAEYFKSRPQGQEIIEWWTEPLREIKFAKKFIAQGGEYQRRLQDRLAQEELQAQVLQFRKEFAERLQQRDRELRQPRSRTEQHQHQRHHHDGRDRDLIPEVLDPESKKGGFFRGLLAELRKAIRRH